MLKGLKLKFILLSMTSLLILLTLLVAGMNLLNYNAVVRDADEVLTILIQNKGTFPGFPAEPEGGHPRPSLPLPNGGDRLPHHMSPEIPYESRYFSVLTEKDGAVLLTDVSRIASVDRATAEAYAASVLSEDCERGFVEDFRYACISEGDSIRVTFLDCGRRLDAFRSFLWVSIGIAAVGFFAVLFVICFFAERILRPISESYEKQKRFITDAGHEIKTPLAVIRANADLLEMEHGPSEALADIQQQTRRLSDLTADLVYLARMEEAEQALPMIDFPLSEVIEEAAAPFRAVARAKGLTLVCVIRPLLTMKGNDKAIRQLVSLLLDNAMKYAAPSSEVCLSLTKQGRFLQLTVVNHTAFAVEEEQLSHVFDRFYRTDPSRNSDTGGHGIGLSVALAIVQAHGGRIGATTDDGHSFRVSALLPQ